MSAWVRTTLSSPRSRVVWNFRLKPTVVRASRYSRWRTLPNRRWTHMSPPDPDEPAGLTKAPKGEAGSNRLPFFLCRDGANDVAGYPDPHPDLARGGSLRPRDRTADASPADARGRKSNRAARQRPPHCREYPPPSASLLRAARDRFRAHRGRCRRRDGVPDRT